VSASSARALVVAGLLAVAFATFAPALEGAFIWDDHPLIEHNRHVAGRDVARALERRFWDVALVEDVGSYYRPLVTLSYILDRHLHGLDPRGFHLTNLLLHLGACLAGFVLLSRLLGALLPAAMGTLLFAVHPSRAEAVAWISGRCDLLMGLFAILALLSFWRALELEGRRRAIALLLGWTAATAAVLSKEAAAVLALLVPTLELLTNPRVDPRGWRRRALVIHLPLLLAASAYLALRVSSLAAQPLRPSRRLYLFLQTVAEYARLLVDPYSPSALLGAAQELVQPHLPALLLGAGATVAVSVLLVALRRCPRARFGLLFFVIGMAPVLNLRPLGIAHMVAERFLYLPFLGLALLGGLWVSTSRVWPRRVGLVLLGVLASSYAVASHRRSADFQDEDRFWRRELELHPGHALALEHLGNQLVRRARFAEAEEIHLRAFRARMAAGRLPPALGNWQRAIEIRLMRSTDGDPFLEEADRHLAELLALSRGGPPARGCLGRECVTLRGDSESVLSWVRAERSNLLASRGVVASRLGDDAAAIRHLDESLALKPNRPEPLLNRALARLRARDLGGAQRDLAAVRAILPDARETRSLEATVRATAPILRALSRYGPEPERSADADAHRLLAQLYIVAKVPRRAERALRDVVRLAPTDAEARALLAYELAILGRRAEARQVIADARRQLGDHPRLRWVEAQIDQPLRR
jgi:tetratricopeptide (TPR) repeat protein